MILVDLSNITTISSSSFLGVVKAFQSVRVAKRQLFLCSMNEQIRILFELTGLDQVFKTFADSDDFNRYLQAQENLVEVSRPIKHSLVQRDSMKLAS